MKKFVYLVLWVLTCSTVVAQWVPVTGRIVSKTEVLAADGSVQEKWQTLSLYSRSSNGSVLIQQVGRSGKPATGELLDYGNTGKAYSLTYNGGAVSDRHRSLDHGFAKNPPQGMSDAQKKISLGHEIVNGSDCFIVPIYDTVANRGTVLVGKAWMAPAYNNLILREELTHTTASGGRRHVVREFKLTGQEEPEKGLFSTERSEVARHWKAIPPTN
jgi:hypothetical protein